MKWTQIGICVIALIASTATGFLSRATTPTAPLAVPPVATPFDDIDPQNAAAYRRLFRDGYEWAHGRHVICPPNTIAGEYRWVGQAWVAGFMAGRSHGGKSAIPGRFAPLVPADVPDRGSH